MIDSNKLNQLLETERHHFGLTFSEMLTFYVLRELIEISQTLKELKK